MNKSMNKRKCLGYMMAGLLAFGGLQSSVNAAMLETNQIATAITLEEKRSEINELMARDDIAKQLFTMGVDADEAKRRVAGLSDAEVNMLHQRIADLPAGSDALGTVLVVLLILMLLDITGVTDIFPRI